MIKFSNVKWSIRLISAANAKKKIGAKIERIMF